MDLKSEIISLLEKAKESEEDFDPFFIDMITTAIRETYGYDTISDEISRWVINLFSRLHRRRGL